ncbi:hypothetical protein M422DRAFT_194268, partial [Sphaerobolus stellatus SS14]
MNNEIPEAYPYLPFYNKEEWSLAEFLATSRLSKGSIDTFFKTPWVQKNLPSFQNAEQLFHHIDKFLPDGPKWHWKEITLLEAPNEPQLLFYRDPIECLQFLAQSPAFDGHQVYAPVKYFSDAEGTNRVYGEMNTGDAWHYYQSVIGREETVNPAILASDATHVTNFSGDGKVHPVYISSGQIHGDIRNQPNRRAFLLLCYLPVCKFGKTQFPNITKSRVIPGRLQARLTHACLKVVLESLQEAGNKAVPMVNYRGEERANRVFLAAWIGDKEEQNLIAALGANSCTGCNAETEDLGDSLPCQPRTSKDILKRIAKVKRHVDPSKNLWDFIKECQSEHLSGVDDPFWKDLPHTDICKVICNDTLHGLHKAFKDHTAQW